MLDLEGKQPEPDGKQPSRRNFLGGMLVGGGGLVLGLSFGRTLRAEAVRSGEDLPAGFAPNAFLRIGFDGKVTVIAKHDEMGQGIFTGFAITICEELEYDPSRVDVVPAPPGVLYNNNAFGLQVTGGSSSTWSSFDQMRSAGAVAREMLIAAAAATWGVKPSACVARDGTVAEREGSRSLGYGELAAAASKLPVPGKVPLKSSSEWRRIGKSTPRLDSPEKVRGIAKFGLDQRVPGMLTAMVARCPYFGGRLKSFDASRAMKLPGIKAVVQVPSGVAVVADGFWQAFKARHALEIDWDPGAGGSMESEDLRALYVAKSKTKGVTARQDGDAESALAKAEDVVEAIYEVPFQAHAPMEPLNCLVTLEADGGASIVTGSQMLGADHPAVVRRLGVDPSLVKIRNSFLGGGFGRRANPKSDWVIEAVEVALAARSLGKPIKTVWTREDDIKGGWYRPMFINSIRAALKGGKITAWQQRIVGQSIAKGTPFEAALIKDGVDDASVEGASDLPFAIPNVAVELHTISLPVPVQWWRSVGHSHTAFAVQSFLDECATALGRDPYDLRREVLAGHPRLLRALDLVAEKAGWSTPPPRGIGRGIAVHESFKGFAAHVVEASVEDGKPHIHRVVVAIDCGPVVNPDQVISQMEGAAIFALSATLSSKVTFADGLVEQGNFDDFQIMRMSEAPAIEVHIVPSEDAMGGIGEVGVPGIAPATCSALFEATGRRIRRLPIGDQLG